MINLSNFVSDIKQIDPVWTFSHYCNIPANHFNGSSIKVTSIFRPEEKTPSLNIYYKNDKIKFKCFASAHAGDHIDLVGAKFDLNYSQSCSKIMTDYSKSTHSFEPGHCTMQKSYKVTGYITRNWTTSDRDFFVPFDIGATILEWGCVKPISQYKMSNGSNQINLGGDHLYGYFTKKNVLYKIYQPMNKECKFITIHSEYETGSEHIEGNKFYVILSSWKDALSFKGLGLSLDIKVPSSENAYFSQEYMQRLKEQYTGGFSFLDADDAGKKAMLHYKKNFGLPFIWLPLSKDLSDSIRDHGKIKVRNTVVPMIHKAINQLVA